MVLERQCTKCSQVKRLDAFTRMRHGKYGRRACCKVCEAGYRKKNRCRIAERDREYNRTHREEIARWRAQYYLERRHALLQYATAHRRQNPHVYANARAKRRAILEQYEPLTKQQWLNLMRSTNWCCAYCGKKLTVHDRTLDHIVPLSKGGGLCVENLTPACRSASIMLL